MTAASEKFVSAIATYGTGAVISDLIAWRYSHPADARARNGSRRDRSALARYTADLDKRLALAEGGKA